MRETNRQSMSNRIVLLFKKMLVNDFQRLQENTILLSHSNKIHDQVTYQIPFSHKFYMLLFTSQVHKSTECRST